MVIGRTQKTVTVGHHFKYAFAFYDPVKFVIGIAEVIVLLFVLFEILVAVSVPVGFPVGLVAVAIWILVWLRPVRLRLELVRIGFRAVRFGFGLVFVRLV